MGSEDERPRRKVPRAHPRIQVNVPVRISIVDTLGRDGNSYDSVLLNLSREGASLQLDVEVPTGVTVTIHWQDKNGLNKVRSLLRWKRRFENSWRIGVKMIDDPRIWSELIFYACQHNTL